MSTLRCGACLRQAWPWHQALAGGLFEHPVSQLVHQFKFGRNPRARRLLSYLMLERIKSIYSPSALPEALVPVPMNWRRRLLRGHNQAEALAMDLAQRTKVPVAAHLLRRRHTRPQEGLSRSARRRNVARAFGPRRPCPFQHVAIVDDVMTTGATLNHVAVALRRAGAQRVDIWVAARTVPPVNRK